MSNLRHGLQQTLCLRQLAKGQLLKPQWQRPSSQVGTKSISTSQPGADTNLTAPPEQPFRGIKNARPLPVSPSYFSREPRFNDAYIKLSTLLQRYQHIPTAPPELVPRQVWKNLKGYRQTTGEPVKAMPYSQVLAMVKRLHSIFPKMMPGEVKEALQEFKRDIDPYKNVPKFAPLDRFGRALGVGRRKTSSARAWVVEGTGEVLVNGKPLNEMFGRIHDRESAIWALRSTARTDKYNVWALVEGGGVTGQAEALTLAVAKAIMVHEPALRPILRKAGCITRDPRTVERKKHGHVKARKMPAWVKR
ncbi:ribosomal protein S9/S16 [Colletotrichum tofieldiae]|uniref:Small ribosomal subunit protein uS9m n=1 Tax=Colletotrichum tofieldiae TaxID=708197 RepID=A0A166RZE9_9PEZI|nr:ribosomal protein S9/S16 [Colletotrichum tofieldiae]GKT58947.1 ribosomal protein S9/S16 [Colletotrichum tofieldiae]GKT77629.1 ribosomal protein S9/S16 [Colletotrichum tofieldiae]GKT85080.1 ribosomal protein S9/S16 [Colletotrichum tofieldiae]